RPSNSTQPGASLCVAARLDFAVCQDACVPMTHRREGFSFQAITQTEGDEKWKIARKALLKRECQLCRHCSRTEPPASFLAPPPAKSNKPIDNITRGGVGGPAIIGHTSLTTPGNAPYLTGGTWGIAMNEGPASAVNDGGHADPTGTGSFAINPDGTIKSTVST